jgi:hypothetical protein
MTLAWRALGAVPALPGVVAVLVLAGLIAWEHPGPPRSVTWPGLIPPAVRAGLDSTGPWPESFGP